MQEPKEGKKRVSVLLIEDNATDAFLTKEILSESERTDYHITVIRSGVDALAYLDSEPRSQNASKPDLILLDLNLPKMHGFEFLERIKTDQGLSAIPVCILTTSHAAQDRERAEELKVGYLLKPLDLKEFEETLSDTV